MDERFTKWTIRKRNVNGRHLMFHNWDTKKVKMRWIIWAPGTPVAACHDFEFFDFEAARNFVVNKKVIP